MSVFQKIWDSKSYLNDPYDRNLILSAIVKPKKTSQTQYQIHDPGTLQKTTTFEKVKNFAKAFFWKVSLSIMALTPCFNKKINKSFQIVGTIQSNALQTAINYAAAKATIPSTVPSTTADAKNQTAGV